MMNTNVYTAFPSFVKQGPDYRALGKTAILEIDSQPLATPPFAQEYFEPGINTKLRRRTKPKVDFTLPSDMPTYPLGFVPTNKTPGANGEEPSIIVRPELVPADLMDVFAKINAEEQAMKQTIPESQMDRGTRAIRDYQGSLRATRETEKRESMIREGFTPAETEKAMGVLRDEEAVKEARMPVKPVSVQEALKGVFGFPNGNGENPTLP